MRSSEESFMSFADLGLSEDLLKAIEAAGYTTPTQIQEQAIPRILEGRDVLGIAQTGTGKTASFTLPMIDRLARGQTKARMPRSLILEPTRELAAQVAENFKVYGRNHKLNMALLIGGVSFEDQEQKLDRGVDVLVATPGRLLDHFERGRILLNGVQILVIDESDRMLDMGFIPDIERIVGLTPFTRQTLFFSATMPSEIRRLTDAFLSNPVIIEASPPATTVELVKQYKVSVPKDDKARRLILRQLIRSRDVKNAIVFCNRKRDVGILARSLQRHGFNAEPLHGDLDQHTRMKTLGNFRDGNIRILVASDVAARGLDIPDVSHIFNFNVPIHAEDYVHRIGRTGRAGRSGEACTLVSPEETKYIQSIVKLIGKELDSISPETKSEPESVARQNPQEKSRKKDSPRPPRHAQTGSAKKSSDKTITSPGDSRAVKPSTAKKEEVLGMGDHVPAFLLRPVRSGDPA